MSSSRSGLSGLGIIELICVAGSIGSAIALIFKEAILGLALAPVSLSLALNLINRNRLEQLSGQGADVSAEVQQLKGEISSLSTEAEKFRQDIQNLAHRQELTSVNSLVEQLNQQQEGLRLSLVPLQSRLDDLIQEYNNRPELKEIENLAAVITALRSSIDELPPPGQLQQPAAKTQSGEDKSTAELNQTLEKVERLDKAINLLAYQFNHRPELGEVASLSVVTESLKQSIEQLSWPNQSILFNTVEQQEETSEEKLAQDSEKVEDLQKEIDLLRHQIQYQLLELQQQVSQSN